MTARKKQFLFAVGLTLAALDRAGFKAITQGLVLHLLASYEEGLEIEQGMAATRLTQSALQKNLKSMMAEGYATREEHRQRYLYYPTPKLMKLLGHFAPEPETKGAVR